MITLFNWLVIAVWLIWFVLYWGPEIRVMRDVRETLLKASNSRLDQLLVIGLSLAILALFFVALMVTLGAAAFPQHEAAGAAGVIVAAGGLAGAFYARRFLGRFWTAVTTVQRDHLVVDKGPYGWVRHPIYTATLAMYLGTTLAFPSAGTALLLLALTVFYSLKALDEERFLTAQLGAAYTDYCQRVRYRLVPGIW
jgi:protein-S-isoprenylcysteine O-methyltransferase Ste14